MLNKSYKLKMHAVKQWFIHIVMARFICFLFDHKIGELNDCGFSICERCNAHEYYDNMRGIDPEGSNRWNNSGWLLIHRKIYWAIKRYKWRKESEKNMYSDGLPF